MLDALDKRYESNRLASQIATMTAVYSKRYSNGPLVVRDPTGGTPCPCLKHRSFGYYHHDTMIVSKTAVLVPPAGSRTTSNVVLLHYFTYCVCTSST